jgi:hypothetical protein
MGTKISGADHSLKMIDAGENKFFIGFVIDDTLYIYPEASWYRIKKIEMENVDDMLLMADYEKVVWGTVDSYGYYQFD